jgi:integrase
MPKHVTPLSHTQIRSAKPKNSEYLLSDGNGLYLKVKPNGTKQFIFNYSKPYTKKRTNISLGLYPDVTLAMAREKALEMRRILSDSLDPQVVAKEIEQNECIRLNNTFYKVYLDWFDIYKETISDDYKTKVIRLFELHVFPSFKNHPIDKIYPKDFIQSLQYLRKERKLETIKRVCQKVNEVMNYAANLGIIKINNLQKVNSGFPPPSEKNLPAISPSELDDFIDLINHSDLSGSSYNLLFFQMHTMLRPSEAASLEWNDIDWNNKLITISASKMKNKKYSHTLPMTDAVVSILNEQKNSCSDSKYVFPSPYNPNRHINKQTVNKFIVFSLKMKGQMCAHGLRSLASTYLNSMGFNSDLIEAALAHRDKNTTRAAYNRTDYLERRRTMMEHWSARILGGKIIPSSKVIKIAQNI